ncbi:hypothetical protein [Serpentinicella alkaliphila]|uniref:Uncharacterized protein n=1 Tax=Serpentinicella alkaliphila TaxID=1734049 RepID=A0A4R2SYJ6_9FIRM|nr:hypothetical protein [Serpentinicella alkaliphila]QUH27038.1 hypothetical protein HZR23_15800 [Serpentinicella alkaliphila]TCP95619.1 hypothetical protein EDD79_10583 [Serpentinicella alkaliphila]
MAQPWPVEWRAYTKNNFPVGDPVDESPGSTDIVGSIEFPAVFYQWDEKAIFFRMRLRQSPLSGTNLVNFNWGVLFSTNTTVTSYDWLFTVNGQSGTLEIWENFIKQPPNSFADQAEGVNRSAPFIPSYSESVVLSSNVRVLPVEDGTNFGGTINYFLDFQINYNKFSSLLEINEGTHLSFIYYTATSNRNANKDIVPNGRTPSESFGDFITLSPEISIGALDVIKEIVDGPSEVKINQTNKWLIEIKVSNPGENNVNEVEVIDNFLVNIEDVQVISTSTGSVNINNNTLVWEVGNIEAKEVHLLTLQLTGSFSTVGEGVLDEVYGKGVEPSIGAIKTGFSTGSAINVLNHTPIPGLEITKVLVSGPTNIEVDTNASWLTEIHVKNISNDNLKDVILSDTLLIEQINSAAVVSVSKGTTVFNHNVFTWRIDNLDINEKATIIIQITGQFTTVGMQALNRVFGAATSQSTGNMIISRHSMDIFINVENVISNNKLNLLKRIIAGPNRTVIKDDNTWRVEIIVNNSGGVLQDVVVEDLILLDNIENINIVEITKGYYERSLNKISWEVGELDSTEAAKIILDIEGSFLIPGPKTLNRSFAIGFESISNNEVRSNISSPDLIDVFNEISASLNITKRIVDGSLSVVVGTENTWVVEIHIENKGDLPIRDILVRDIFILDNNINVDIISISRGSVKMESNNLSWSINKLPPGEKSVLTFRLTGTANSIGRRGLNAIIGRGIVEGTGVEIISGPIADLFIYVTDVLPDANLVVNKNVIEGPTTLLSNSMHMWKVVISVQNLSQSPISEIIIRDEILIDEIVKLYNIEVTEGIYQVYDGTIIWSIENLKPGESTNLYVTIFGSFYTLGKRAINRTFASAIDESAGQTVYSHIRSAEHILITDFIAECIMANKIYSVCQQRECLDKVRLSISGGPFKILNITFKNGEIIPNSLDITKIKGKNFSRVKFQMVVPINIKLRQIDTGTIINIESSLPIISKDIIMFIPEGRDEFRLNIVTETASKLLSNPIFDDNSIMFKSGVFILIKAVGEVQLHIPTYGFCAIPEECEEYRKDICTNFNNLNFPEFFPQYKENLF